MKISKIKLIAVFSILMVLILSNISFSQLTRNWYYESSIMPSGTHYLYNKSENLCWGEAYHQNAFLDLWEISKDTTWLDEMVVRLNGMMNTLWDVPPPNIPCNLAVYQDGFLGWGSTYYDPNGYYQEYMVHDGMILVPIARFIRYVYNDSLLYQRYGTEATSYLNIIESNLIAKWYANWEGDSLQSGLELEHWGGWRKIPNNQYIIFGAAMVILYEISGNPNYTPANPVFPDFYLQESIAMADYFKGFMTYRSVEDAYLWGYWWTYPPAEHISYGYMEMIFILEAFAQGIEFNSVDMDRYTNTFTELMWNGSFQNPYIAGYIDGTGSNEGYFSWTWTSLTEFDFLVWRIVHAYHEMNYSLRRKEGIARLALTTQLYDHSAPAAPASPTITLLGGIYYLSWTAPATDDGGSNLTGLAGYNVYRSDTPGGTYTQINQATIKTNIYANIDTNYYYAVTAIDYHIPSNESPRSEIISDLPFDRADEPELIVKSYLLPNYPNPFNAGTTINFSISGNAREKVDLRIYDCNGKLISVLLNEYKLAGSYKIFWNGRNEMDEEVSSGVYLCVLEVGQQTTVRKVTLIK